MSENLPPGPGPWRSIFPGILSDNPSAIPTTAQDHGGPSPRRKYYLLEAIKYETIWAPCRVSSSHAKHSPKSLSSVSNSHGKIL